MTSLASESIQHSWRSLQCHVLTCKDTMELDLAIGELLVVDKHGLDLIGVAFIPKDERRTCERSAHIVLS